MKAFLEFINSNSSYYKNLWAGSELDINTLPIASQDEFWDANTWENNSLLTGAPSDGVVFKSGGTTGRPKFSFFTKSEWEEFTNIFGRSMASVVKDGDRVGNLFYAGELYASFLFIEKSLEYCPANAITFPIAGATKLEEMINLVRVYGINVLAGVPTTFLSLAQELVEKGETLKLDRILYGGETLFDDQKPLLIKAFENPQIESVGYASVDAGHLGGSAPELGPRIHKVLSGTIMQIVDDNGELITEPGIAGRLLMTNLTRKLMPIIRYPVGDMARWHKHGESFEILGRADEGARIGPVTVNRDDIASVISKLSDQISFQLVINRFEGKDQLVVQYQGQLDEALALTTLLKERKMLADSIEKGLVAVPRFVATNQLERNPRTGKLKFVIDKRF